MLTEGAKVSHVGVLFQLNSAIHTWGGEGGKAGKKMFVFHSDLKILRKPLFGSSYLGAGAWQQQPEGRNLIKDMLLTPPPD